MPAKIPLPPRGYDQKKIGNIMQLSKKVCGGGLHKIQMVL